MISPNVLSFIFLMDGDCTTTVSKMQRNRLNRVSYLGDGVCFRNGCDYIDPETKEQCLKIDSRPYSYGRYCVQHRCQLNECCELKAENSDYCTHHREIRERSRTV